jgi:uncharacterized membrane protein YfcA
MENYLPMAVTVFFFSTVQSLFGVGLLVFGTPTLLLLGYSFVDTIAALLPASLVISLMQAWHGKEHVGELKKNIPFYAVPFIVLGLALVLSKVLVVDFKLLVGVLLLCTAVIRFNEKVQQALAALLKKHTKLYLMLTGFVHGLSNMGGGFLTMLATSIYHDKESTRANIAFGYLVFALSQILVVLVLHREAFGLHCLVLAAVALLTYRTVGNVIYMKSSQRVYQFLITIFIFAYGVVLIGQRWFK